MDRHSDRTAHALGVLSVLAAIAALYLLKTILIPIAFAMVVACMFSPLARFFRSTLAVRADRGPDLVSGLGSGGHLRRDA